MTPAKLNNRIAVVTGAAQGIGRAIAESLAREGVFVHCIDIREKSLDEMVAGIGEADGQALAHLLDLSEPDALISFASQLAERTSVLDILVNNAGIANDTPLEKLSLKDFRKINAVNVEAPLFLTRELTPMLRASKAGRVINIASVEGLRGSFDSTAYGTSKGAIVNLTRSLACDLAQFGILVNAIAPGFIETNMAQLADGKGSEYDTDWFQEVYVKHRRIPLGRPGTPSDVAALAVFLSSVSCRYITGQIIPVDGGLTAVL